MDERALAAAARKGSVASFNELARRHQDAAYNVACRLLGSPTEAGGATQEALFAAYRALPAWAGGSFRAWMLRCVVRACRERRQRATAPAAPARNASLYGAGQPTLRAAEAALAGLPWEERVVLVLADVQGLSYDEVAWVAGASLAEVRRRLHEGRRRLERVLSTDCGNGCGWP